MFISLNNLGSMVLDINGNTLDAKFLRENGATADYFRIVKGIVVPLPPAPSALTATAVSRTQINLSWTDNSGDESGFKIERCRNASCTNFAQIAQVGANVTTFADTTVSKNTAYNYRVRAFNTSGNSSYSNTAGAKTPK
jgi:predicted phage tail protein